MAGRKRLPDIMGEALGWLENESPIVKANGSLVEVGALPCPDPMPGAKVVAIHQPAAEPDDKLVAKLEEMRLTGMSKALRGLSESPRARMMSFDELLWELLQAEEAEREHRRFLSRLGKARLPNAQAGLNDYDFDQVDSPGIMRLKELHGCDWIYQARDLAVQGEPGVGKTLLACILAREACVRGFSAVYRRLGSFMREMAEARKDERRFARIRRAYVKADLLVIDDWGIERLPSWQSLDLFELLEERHGQGSTMIISRWPYEKWSGILDENLLPGAIMADLLKNAVERLVNGSIRLEIIGKS